MQNKKQPTHSTIPYLPFFKRGLYWNLFDSLSSQGLVVLFHLLLRTFYGTHLHGAMGCLLSLFYIALILCNGGLDQSLAPFLERFTQNRSTFRSFFYTVLLPQLPFLTLNVLIVLSLYNFLCPRSLLPFTITTSFGALIGLSFVLESMRKTFRTFLQLIFYNRLTAFVETSNMVLYISFILLCNALKIPLTLERLWTAFTVLILLQIGALAAGISNFFQTLPSDDTTLPSFKLAQEMIPTRLFTWGNQSMAQLFSGNLLVPLCALTFGIEQASLVKIMSTLSHWVSLISHKTFGISSNALLAHLKSKSLATQQHAFLYLSSLLAQLLYFLGIFLLFNAGKIIQYYVDTTTPIAWSLLYFMLINNFLESLFVLYEKWYIFEEEAVYLLIFNGISLSTLYLVFSSITSPLVLAFSTLTIRALTLLSITLFSSYRWNIWPSYKPRIVPLSVALIISALFYFFV